MSTSHPAANGQHAYGWLALCFLGNTSLEVIEYLRRDPAIGRDFPLLIGSGRNFAAVFAIGGALVAIAIHSPMGPLRRMHPTRRVNWVLWFTLVGLLVWEAVQPLTTNGVFDWYDVAATCVAFVATLRLWPLVRWLRVDKADASRAHAGLP
jgi:hypothetical protein